MSDHARSDAVDNNDDLLGRLGVKTRLSIYNPNTNRGCAFDERAAALLSNIKEYGSLKMAAEKLPLSYSRAWLLVSELECCLGIQLVIREKPKGFLLTDAANRILDAYFEVNKEIADRAEKKFADCAQKVESPR